ncbi:MAG: Asp-tRNA(Asn)/Glu-tRNA(Gln) amidotransferase subunit GatC [Candidatus Saccharimonadaceae bacterium]|jgi:aspartyl/glutamyl-tRNA(Asn/Gln) amidotransferase C subunit|nr:Asp-tRNA(Asn)/Glu-tRNA(Gln) amidotransferase subunit GatC [Candidatus Saccharimonadaceae bacterium]
MKEITKEVLKDAAKRLLFDMSEEEYDTLLKEFDVVIKQMQLIGQIEGVDDYEPMVFPFECTTSYLRDDIPSKPLTKDEALRNAKNKSAGQIKVPKVVG